MNELEQSVSLSTDRIWRSLRSRITGYLRTRVRDPEDVQDLLQEAFLKIHRSLPTLEDEVATDAWVYRIVRNLVVDHHRARSVRPEGLPQVDLEDLDRNGTAPNGSADSPFVRPEVEAFEERRFRTEIVECLLPMMRFLPAEQREALELVEIRGLTQVEAAQRTGITVSGMKSRVQRARQRMREVIDGCCNLELDAHGAILDCNPCAGRESPGIPQTPGDSCT